MLWELMKWSPDGKSFDQQTNSLNQFFKEMYGDQFGEFVFGYWGLKGYNHAWHPPILEAHLGGACALTVNF